MQKKIKILLLLGSISGFYLTVAYAGFATSGFFGSEPFFSNPLEPDKIPLIAYYAFNCFCLLILFLIYRKDIYPRVLKIVSAVLLVSFFASLFFPIGATGKFFEESYFVTSIIGGAWGGLMIPFLGIIPVSLFLGGIVSSAILLLRKIPPEILDRP